MSVGTSELTIQEQLTARRREIVLRGAGLPFMGANFPGAQRAITTWYPGNSAQATQHVLGPVERQSQWTGEWNTTRLSRSPCIYRDNGVESEIVVADDLRAIVEDLYRSGALLLVTWTSLPSEVVGERKIVREGRCIEWNWQYDRIDDIKWQMTFDWVGRGRSQQKTIGPDPNANEGILQALQQAASEFDRSVVYGPLLGSSKFNQIKSANRFTLGQLEALVDAPSRFMSQFGRAANLIVSRARYLGDIIGKARNLPFEIAGQAVDVASNAIATANNFFDEMSRVPVEEMALQNRVAILTRNASYYGDGVRQSQYISAQAQRVRTQFGALSRGPQAASGEAGRGQALVSQAAGIGDAGRPLAIYLVREGDTLFSISLRFYGTEAGMYGIALANSLRVTETTLPVGRTLYIPPLQAAQAGALQPFLPPRPATAPGRPASTEAGGLTPNQGGGPSIVSPGSPLPGAS